MATDKEAKEKWCPFASSRVVSWRKEPNHIVNAVMGEVQTVTCIASACMAWRPEQDAREPHGYCGLAGKP